MILSSVLLKEKLNEAITENMFNKAELKLNINLQHSLPNPNQIFFYAVPKYFYKYIKESYTIKDFENKNTWGQIALDKNNNEISRISKSDFKNSKYSHCPKIQGDFGISMAKYNNLTIEDIRIISFSKENICEFHEVSSHKLSPAIIKIDSVLGIKKFEISDSKNYKIQYYDLSKKYLTN